MAIIKEKISIIIPTLNEAANLRSLLPYLQEYKDDNSEIIVADACKTSDDTLDICRSYQIKHIKCDGCSRASQMNVAAAIAEGDIFYFIHADVRPPKSFISDIRRTFQEGYDFGIFCYEFDSKSWLLSINAKFTRGKGIFAGGGDQSLCIRRSTFIELGGYDETYSIMEDFRFFQYAKRNGLEYDVIQNPVIVSARKYEKNSYLRVNLSNLVAFSMFHLGMHPDRIKKAYSLMLNPS